jgi:hypothetical protein
MKFHNITLNRYIALAILIPTQSYHRTVRFKTDGMPVTHSDRYNNLPAAYIVFPSSLIGLSIYYDECHFIPSEK